MKKERYFYLDVLKTIAVFFVCLYHFYIGGIIGYSNNLSIANYIERFLFNICSCCVPLFFMLNGALVLNRELNIRKHLKKCGKIFIQCLIWKCIAIIICTIFNNIKLLKYSPYTLFNSIFFTDMLEGINLTEFWFIYVLLCIYFLLPFIKKTFDLSFENNEYKLYLTFILSLLFVSSFLKNDVNFVKNVIPVIKNINITSFDCLTPFRWLVGPMLLYFLLGGIMGRRDISHKKHNCTISVIMIFIGLCLLLVEWYIQSSNLGLNFDIVFDGNSTMATLLISVGVFDIIQKLYSRIEYNNIFITFFNKVGSNTLGIYYIHWIIGNTFIYKYLMFKYNAFYFNILKALVLIIICTIISEAIKKIPILKNILE